jgi:hypothetical protein
MSVVCESAIGERQHGEVDGVEFHGEYGFGSFNLYFWGALRAFLLYL